MMVSDYVHFINLGELDLNDPHVSLVMRCEGQVQAPSERHSIAVNLEKRLLPVRSSRGFP